MGQTETHPKTLEYCEVNLEAVQVEKCLLGKLEEMVNKNSLRREAIREMEKLIPQDKIYSKALDEKYRMVIHSWFPK